jgi:hypothetical protein
MTTDQIIARLARCTKRIKVLQADNQRVWESRERWKAKHRAAARENTALRRRVKFLEESRDMWRARAPRRRKAEWKNIHLREGDLETILRIRASKAGQG